MSKYIGCIGLFWYIDDKDTFEYRKFDLSAEVSRKENVGSEFITPLLSHPMLWGTVKKKLGSDKNYNYTIRVDESIIT